MSEYTLYITPSARREAKDLPGNVRQRVKKIIESLADDPLPQSAKKLDLPDFTEDVRRIRLDKWRIVYAVNEAEKIVDVLAVRKRPPYDYGDLQQLLGDEDND